VIGLLVGHDVASRTSRRATVSLPPLSSAHTSHLTPVTSYVSRRAGGLGGGRKSITIRTARARLGVTRGRAGRIARTHQRDSSLQHAAQTCDPSLRRGGCIRGHHSRRVTIISYTAARDFLHAPCRYEITYVILRSTNRISVVHALRLTSHVSQSTAHDTCMYNSLVLHSYQEIYSVEWRVARASLTWSWQDGKALKPIQSAHGAVRTSTRDEKRTRSDVNTVYTVVT
jgi:hypothetical protein